MGRLEGRAAVVTGAGRGIGKAIALRFAQEGAEVALLDIRGDLVEAAARQISRNGMRALAIQVDVLVQRDVERAVSEAVRVYGRIDILVNNAGIGGSKACLETQEAEWDRMLAVNLKSVFLLCRQVIPEMIKVGKGKIINIASIYGILGSPHTAAYSASKGGVVNFTRQLAVDYACQNIYVNAISPGLIETEMTRHKLEGDRDANPFVQAIPLRRPGLPQDITGAALFLASDDSDFITGHNLVVDGGHSCKIA
jgi:NAD(P)-dependent dehydrogenase (short-subunit alcohol dehydrogenase family)